MAYTAPIGSAVDFVFSGEAYSAPAGNDVDLSFRVAVEGACAFQIPLAVTASGFVQVVGQGAGALSIAAYATDLPWRTGTGRVTLVIAATGEGEELAPLGTGSAALSVTAAGSGFGPVVGEMQRELRLAAYATGSAAAGYGATTLQLSGTASGSSPQLGIGNAYGFVSATGAGNVGRTGYGSGLIPLAGLGAAVSVVGTGNVLSLLRAAGSAASGRTGTASARIPFASRASGAHGVSGHGVATMISARASGAVAGYTSGSGVAPIPIICTGFGTQRKVHTEAGQLFVLSRHNSITVRHEF